MPKNKTGTPKKRVRVQRGPSRRGPRGWEVYVIGPLNGYHKIGFSGDVDRRVEKGFSNLPGDILIRVRIATYQPLWLERYLHIAFKDVRWKGEWFKLTEEDIQLIAQIKPSSFIRVRSRIDGIPEEIDSRYWRNVNQMTGFDEKKVSPEAMEAVRKLLKRSK